MKRALLFAISVVTILSGCPEYPRCTNSETDCPASHECNASHECVPRADAGNGPVSSSSSKGGSTMSGPHSSSSLASSSTSAMPVSSSRAASSSLGASSLPGSSSSTSASMGMSSSEIPDAGPPVCNPGCGACETCVNGACVVATGASCTAQCGNYLAGLLSDDLNAECARFIDIPATGTCNAQAECIPDFNECAANGGMEHAPLVCNSDAGCTPLCDSQCVNPATTCQRGAKFVPTMPDTACLTNQETEWCGGQGCVWSDGGFTPLAFSCNASGRCEGLPTTGTCTIRCVEDSDCPVTTNCNVDGGGVCMGGRDAGIVPPGRDAGPLMGCAGASDGDPCQLNCADYIYGLVADDEAVCSRNLPGAFAGTCVSGACTPGDGGLPACRDMGPGEELARCDVSCARNAMEAQKCVPGVLASVVTGPQDLCFTNNDGIYCTGGECTPGPDGGKATIAFRGCTTEGRCELNGSTAECMTAACGTSNACDRECASECPNFACYHMQLLDGGSVCARLE